MRGWVSQAGLMPVPVNQAAPPAVTPPPVSTNGPNLICDAPHVFIGDEPDSNPVVSVEVSYRPDDHAWRIFHHRANGQVISRGEQYAITDWSDANKTQWTGSLYRNRFLYMIGEVKKNANGEPIYNEWLYDRGKGNKLVMQMAARCASNTPEALPQPTPSAPAAPAPAKLEDVKKLVQEAVKEAVKNLKETQPKEEAAPAPSPLPQSTQETAPQPALQVDQPREEAESENYAGLPITPQEFGASFNSTSATLGLDERAKLDKCLTGDWVTCTFKLSELAAVIVNGKSLSDHAKAADMICGVRDALDSVKCLSDWIIFVGVFDPSMSKSERGKLVARLADSLAAAKDEPQKFKTKSTLYTLVILPGVGISLSANNASQ